MARTVTDRVQLLDVIAGVGPADGATAEAGSKIPPTYTAFLKRDGGLGRRIGVLRQASRPDASDPQVLSLFDRAIADLRTAGRRSLILSSCQSSTNSRPDSIRSAKFERLSNAIWPGQGQIFRKAWQRLWP